MPGFLARVLPKEWESEFAEITQGLERLGVRFATRDTGWGFEWVVSGWDILKLPRERREGPRLPSPSGHRLTRIRKDHILYPRYVEDFPYLLEIPKELK